MIVARSAHTGCLISFLPQGSFLQQEGAAGGADFSPSHCQITELCSGFWELLEGAGSGQYYEKRVFVTVIGSLKFIFLSSIHVLACPLTGLRNLLGRNCSWKFSSMSCMGSQGMQS